MSTERFVNLYIKNNTNSSFALPRWHFNDGGLAEGNSWPNSIDANGGILQVKCCGKDKVSGYVTYETLNPAFPIRLFFSFSCNDNEIEVGTDPSVLEHMDHHSVPRQRVFLIKSETGESGISQYVTVDISSTSGNTNDARWIIKDVNTEQIIANSDYLNNVKAVFLNIKGDGRLVQYKFADYHSVESHFKGVASFKDKLIFTHTNLQGVDYIGPLREEHNGVVFIGNKVAPGLNDAAIEAHYRTEHDPKWAHPGGVQVCGSYMAMGIQRSDNQTDRNKGSEIQICDIRKTQVNERMESPPAEETAVITRPNDGINGVGITRELSTHGEGGRYIVAGIQGYKLSLYRSRKGAIHTEENKFDEIEVHPSSTEINGGFLETADNNFPENGPGLGLVTQKDGNLFLITMHGSQGGPSTLTLYSITITDGNPTKATWERVENCKKKLTTSNSHHCSFRWGKGLSVTSPTSVEVYATSRTTIFGDFETLTWKGGN